MEPLISLSGERSPERWNAANVCVVIPALNEEATIGDVVRAVLRQPVGEVIVVDNGSTDQTAARARAAGARILAELRRGYGRACQSGIEALGVGCGIVAFLDGDGSDCPEFLPQLIEPIAAGRKDFVIGSRIRGQREPGSMNPQQILAGRLAGILLHGLYGVRYTDMGPFRAISTVALQRLDMSEMTYGWNLEMQMRAASLGLRIEEIPVDHRLRRGGHSKVSGNLLGSLRALVRILLTFLRLAFSSRTRKS
ncbi:MAG TPA: glycosyltransferase family 2 protein [Dongiaceae bacterium]|jgi:glycosyltransferase involved in cell wall biosynthesis